MWKADPWNCTFNHMLDVAAVTGAEMLTACLSKEDLCKIFDVKTPGRGSSFTWDDLLPQATSTPVRVIVRSDSSGSTNVMRDTLIGLCGAGFTMVTPSTPGVLAGDGTSGVVNLAKATPNSITYAACGQAESANFRQIAVSNKRNVRHFVRAPNCFLISGITWRMDVSSYRAYGVGTLPLGIARYRNIGWQPVGRFRGCYASDR